MSRIRGKRLFTAELRANHSSGIDTETVSAADVLDALDKLGDMMRGTASTPAEPPPAVNPEVTAVATELSELSRRIQQVKSEVGAIKHPLASTDRITDATTQLDTIVSDMEVATDRILEGAEQVEATLAQFVVFSGGNEEISKLSVEANGHVTRMMEACSFQDVSGQRVAKVVRLFTEIETHITTIIDYFGPEAFANVPVSDIEKSDELGVVLHGPQSGGQGISQDEIDALFD